MALFYYNYAILTISRSSSPPHFVSIIYFAILPLSFLQIGAARKTGGSSRGLYTHNKNVGENFFSPTFDSSFIVTGLPTFPSVLPTFIYCFLKCPFYKAFYAFLNSALPFYPISLWVETFHSR